MTLTDLITLLQQIPASASDFLIYPTNKETLYFSLSAGAISKGHEWKPAVDIQPSEGLSRFKIYK